MNSGIDLRRWTVAAVACSLLLLAAATIFRRAAADVQARSGRSPREIERACLADPGRASCWARLAEARELLGADASPEWRAALERNPRDPSVLAQAAISAESQRAFPEAERLLLQAESYNRLWLPRWTLANFYYRRNRKPEFWQWMRAALERSYGDLTAAFHLCRDAGGNAGFLLDKVLPDTPEIRRAFVSFLIAEHQLDDLPTAAERYASAASPSDQQNVTAALIASAESLVTSHRAEPALRLWNHLAARNYIPYGSWSAESPLFNARFQKPLDPPAFDWRTPADEGVTVLFGAPVDGVKISLSGRQSEHADLLTQYLVLQPARRYHFAFEFQTPGINTAETALEWVANDVETGDPYLIESPALASPAWTRQSIWLQTPKDARPRLTRLSLVAGRKIGFARMQGEAWFRRMRMEAH